MSLNQLSLSINSILGHVALLMYIGTYSSTIARPINFDTNASVARKNTSMLIHKKGLMGGLKEENMERSIPILWDVAQF